MKRLKEYFSNKTGEQIFALCLLVSVVAVMLFCAIDGVNYNMAKNACDVTNAIHTSTRDIIDAQRDGTNAILNFLTQDKIATLQAENQSLKFAASQTAQNAYLTATIDAGNAELIRRLGRDCPIPAYVVPNPNCCYGTPVGVLNNNGYGCNGGCGCGC